MTEKQIIAIGDLNYLWGLSVTMAKALEYDPDEIGNIGQMFKNIEFYLKNGDEEEEGHNHSVVIQCVHCRFSFPDKPITIRANWDASEFKYVNDMTEFNKAAELWNKRADMNKGETK